MPAQPSDDARALSDESSFDTASSHHDKVAQELGEALEQA